jgi:uncharacterized protein YdeI (YjbR/CyaY-like superfamily)
MTPTFFPTAADFREWLDANHAGATELEVGFHKVDSGLPSMTWSESVDEALCFGWIDGIRRRIDDTSYQIRFTPRRMGSNWSGVNVARVQALLSQRRMRPAGIAAFEARSAARTGVYSFEQAQPPSLFETELRAFKRRKAAWSYFESTPPSYRRTVVHWIASAKQAATRQRRLAQLIEACVEGRRMAK